MKENVGYIDRMIRFVIAIVFIIIGITVSPWWYIVAVFALVTGLIGWCPVYAMLGISTKGAVEAKTASKPAKKARAAAKRH